MHKKMKKDNMFKYYPQILSSMLLLDTTTLPNSGLIWIKYFHLKIYI